ncbi:hypothetical protein BGZ60DRAFT_394405 [Tricladium varicosporioides]|nr:hypothetical protein BGZ60DRAFT_394405 [Hymenoscyphus varicosporioides]
MGTILSTISIATSKIKKRDRKKKNQGSENSGLQGTAREFATTSTITAATKLQPQDTFQRGLRDEHLSTSASPSLNSPLESQGQSISVAGSSQARAEELPVADILPKQEVPTPELGELVVKEVVGVEAPLPGVISTPPATSTTTNKMASDEDYSSFLNKVNEDPSSGTAKSQSSGKKELKALDEGVEIPAILKKATEDAYYVSDADEPFVPVTLKWSGKKLPGEKEFAKLVNHPDPKKAEVSISDVKEWDPQGQYKELVEAVKEACGGEVKVYRVEKEGARVEYWVIGLRGGQVLGAKALAVES